MTARRTAEIAVGILPIALVLALWQGIVASGIAPPVLLPAPGAVFARLIEQMIRAHGRTKETREVRP